MEKTPPLATGSNHSGHLGAGGSDAAMLSAISPFGPATQSNSELNHRAQASK